MTQNILNYWYALEFFNPCWPVESKHDTNLLRSELSWLKPQNSSNNNIRVTYDVYLGRATSNDLIAWLLSHLGLSPEETAIEDDSSVTCLCALKINQVGQYVAGSFALSSFVWAIGNLAHAGSIEAKLNTSELEKIQTVINNRLLDIQRDVVPPPLSRKGLDNTLTLSCEKAMVDSSLIKASLWCRTKVERTKRTEKFPPLNPFTELMQSFYLKDLATIMAAPTDTVDNYVQAMIREKNNRIQIDTDVKQMQHCLRAEAFPLGVWPSQYSPSLMQQIGINLATSGEQKVFSVNGPPGTGKTTLLKEIVAFNIVQRAIVMDSYDTPGQAFQKESFQNPSDWSNQFYFKLDKRLSAYGILVASNNNAAVENISVELPKSIKKDRTGHFSKADTESGGNTYFADVATKLLDKPAWGLISARLGKHPNLKALIKHLWWADDGVTLKRYYNDGEIPDWGTARKNFRLALQAVRKAQKEIARAQALSQEQESAIEAQATAHIRDEEAHNTYSEQERMLLNKQQELKDLEQMLTVQEQNAATLQNRLSFLKRFFWRWFPNDAVVKEWILTKQAVERLVIQVTRQKADCCTQVQAVQQAKTQSEISGQALIHAQQHLDAIRAAIAPYRVRFGENWADASFWQNISTNERSEAACPWTNFEYDKLREELFYQALMLQKAFVLSGDYVQTNLDKLFALWDGKFTTNGCAAYYGDLLNTLMLVIPVISTTFASVQTFLKGIQAKELGLLIVDEAGQATPQSALGALWRTQKAIIVGDPLQVEPIVTIPKELRKRFADEYDIPPVYRLPELSVQILADQLNRYGGIRKLNGEEFWLGSPLIVHRRCIEPMFRISNEVAYNGRILSKTKPHKLSQHFLFESSVWLDCKGAENGNKDHAVREQVQLAAHLLERGIEVYGGFPDIYIITPFTSIKRALKKALRLVIRRKLPQANTQDVTDWLQKSCGTIHTFQGKEAAEVLLVLGCDAQSGLGAARWVGQKPNIINVAVSRAKFRLAVIGDYDLWKHIPYVQTVCKYLTRYID